MQELELLKTPDIAKQVTVILAVLVDEAHSGDWFSLLNHALSLTFNSFSLIYLERSDRRGIVIDIAFLATERLRADGAS